LVEHLQSVHPQEPILIIIYSIFTIISMVSDFLYKVFINTLRIFTWVITGFTYLILGKTLGIKDLGWNMVVVKGRSYVI